MSYLPSLPEPADLVDIFKKYPKFSQVLLKFNNEVMRGPGSLSDKDRELLFAYGSGINECSYCLGIHDEAATNLGVESGTVENLLCDINSPLDDPKLRPAISFVKKLTQEPNNITAQDTKAILDAGWDERALFDIVQVCALVNYMNRMVSGLGLTALGDNYFNQVGQMLAKHGYENQ